MQKLAEYLIKHLIVDFEGEMDDKLLESLAGDDDAGRRLVAKIREEGGFDDFIVDFLDMLKMTHLETGINRDVVVKELREYAESD